MSGTSMASPHVAGAAALYLAANPGATPAQVRNALVQNATQGKITGPGSGSPNVLLFVGTGDTSPSPTASPTQQPGNRFSNDNDVPIVDFNRPGVSSIVVSGQSGNAPADLSVGVRLVCPNRGQVSVELISPSGNLYQLKPIDFGDNAPNLNATYTVNGSFSRANGTWQLRVRAFNFNSNNGFIDGWSLTF